MRTCSEGGAHAHAASLLRRGLLVHDLGLLLGNTTTPAEPAWARKTIYQRKHDAGESQESRTSLVLWRPSVAALVSLRGRRSRVAPAAVATLRCPLLLLRRALVVAALGGVRGVVPAAVLRRGATGRRGVSRGRLG